jgi:hypothetical protein
VGWFKTIAAPATEICAEHYQKCTVLLLWGGRYLFEKTVRLLQGII